MVALVHAMEIVSGSNWGNTANQDLKVSLMILVLGVPFNPYAASNAVVLYLPAGFMPVQESAALSKSKSWLSETAADWWPCIPAGKADPVQSFLALLVIFARLEILFALFLMDLNLLFGKLLGLLLPEAYVMPKSLVEVATL